MAASVQHRYYLWTRIYLNICKYRHIYICLSFAVTSSVITRFQQRKTHTTCFFMSIHFFLWMRIYMHIALSIFTGSCSVFTKVNQETLRQCLLHLNHMLKYIYTYIFA